jgi:hypothetical protein
MVMDIVLIWVRREAEYFCKGHWTTQITLIAKANFLSARSASAQGAAR